MTVSGLAGLLGRGWATMWGAARSPLLCHSLRKTSSSQGGKSEPSKQSLKKPKLPEGRFDAPEDSHLEKEPLESEYKQKVTAPSSYSVQGAARLRLDFFSPNSKLSESPLAKLESGVRS
nr:succinate dehydrogenase assembly factor 4, mitochondrial isoform X1 [Loxodonta africana]